ncbi:TPA: AAA family ATPase [Vibrio parahaemolyticus]|nr:AAA family ATPase [Vibrio parahaemolyticus]
MSELVNYVNELSGGNQFLSATLMALIGGLFTYWLREFPLIVFRFCKRELTTSVEIDTKSSYGNDVLLAKLGELISTVANENACRRFSYTRIWDGTTGKYRIGRGLGYGKAWVIHDGTFILINRFLRESGMESHLSIELTCIGRSAAPIDSFVSLVAVDQRRDELAIFNLNTDGAWASPIFEKKRDFDVLALNPDTRTAFSDKISRFMSGEERYKQLDLPWKETFLLHGRPGSGKTSIIKALASKYNLPIYRLNLSSLSNSGLERAFMSVPDNSLILIEDFDSASSVLSRVPSTKSHGDNPDKASTPVDDEAKALASVLTSLDMSTVLNVLDGIVSLHGVLVFLTTNHLEHIDKAVFRDGRVDHLIDLPLLTPSTVKAYLESIYPELCQMDIEYPEISASKLTKWKSVAHDDVNKLVEQVHSHQPATLSVVGE